MPKNYAMHEMLTKAAHAVTESKKAIMNAQCATDAAHETVQAGENLQKNMALTHAEMQEKNQVTTVIKRAIPGNCADPIRGNVRDAALPIFKKFYFHEPENSKKIMELTNTLGMYFYHGSKSDWWNGPLSESSCASAIAGFFKSLGSDCHVYQDAIKRNHEVFKQKVATITEQALMDSEFKPRKGL